MTLDQRCHDALGRAPSTQAIEYRGHWYDWGWMRGIADEIERSLVAAGIDSLTPIGFAPRNRPSAAAALLGMIAAGRTIRMIYAFQSPEGIARDVARLKLGAIIAAQEDLTAPVIEAAREQGLLAIGLSEDAARIAAGLSHATAAPDPDAPHEPTLQILTSGTTGAPKHFSLNYDMIEKHIVGINVAFSNDKTDFANEPPALLYFPFGNISGIYGLLPLALKGQKAVLLDKFDVHAWHNYILRHRPARSGLPPAGVRMILDAGIPREDLASLKAIGTGAAPLDPSVQRAFEETYGIPILLSYGATEFGGPVTAMTADLHAQFGQAKFGSVGRPFAGAKLRVLDPETEEVLPPGSEGVLEVQTPRLGPHWIRTTDIGMIDEDGFLFHLGRSDGAIMRGGFKLLPETIGRALVLHSSVAAAAVVGIKDDRLGQVPVAAIQLIPGSSRPTEKELEVHLRQHVYATHLPVAYRIVDALPRTPSLKVDLPAVRALFAETG